MKLTDNLTLKEAIKSQTAIRRGISNSPTEEEVEKLKLTAKMVFQPIREHFGIPIGITSMFRSKLLNTALKGATSSQHTKAEAIDIDADVFGGKVMDSDGKMVTFTNKMIFDFIKENLEYDQLIWEYGTNESPAWVHVSYKATGNRFRDLKCFKNSQGRTQYSNM